jgi:hypothetical protein
VPCRQLRSNELGPRVADPVLEPREQPRVEVIDALAPDTADRSAVVRHHDGVASVYENAHPDKVRRDSLVRTSCGRRPPHGAAEAIVTGDKDLLEDAELATWLGHRGISVITPANLLDLLES